MNLCDALRLREAGKGADWPLLRELSKELKE
jgi:hypothetical protein